MTISVAASAHDHALSLLRQELRRNWAVGDRLPPIKQLAGTLNVGQTTLHRAAAQLAQEGVLVASTRRGTFVARLPGGETSAKTSARARVRRAALLQLPTGQTDPFLQPAVARMRRRLKAQGVDVQTVEVDIRCNLAPGESLEGFDALITLQPSGLIQLANDVRCPALVLTTAEVEPMAIDAGYDMVSADSEQGAWLAGRWMRRVAPASVGFIGVSATRQYDRLDDISLKRLAGFERGLGQRVPRPFIFISGAFRHGIGEEVFEQYRRMSTRPQGLFCASDDLAFGFMEAARARGLHAGVDFQLIGFDGQVRGQTAPDGPLTTARVPTRAMGNAAADLLISRLRDPDQPVRRVLLSCDFIEGRTARLAPSTHS
jgi:DNA-binding LacI/PurR family transcriptional regulator